MPDFLAVWKRLAEPRRLDLWTGLKAAAPLWHAAGAALRFKAVSVNLKGCRLLAFTWHEVWLQGSLAETEGPPLPDEGPPDQLRGQPAAVRGHPGHPGRRQHLRGCQCGEPSLSAVMGCRQHCAHEQCAISSLLACGEPCLPVTISCAAPACFHWQCMAEGCAEHHLNVQQGLTLLVANPRPCALFVTSDVSGPECFRYGSNLERSPPALHSRPCLLHATMWPVSKDSGQGCLLLRIGRRMPV